MRRVLVVLLGVFVFALIPAAADAGTATPANGQNGLVVFSGDASVAPDETVDSVVVFSGAATVDGSVTGSVVVFSGPVTISGNVRGDVVVFDGLLTVQSGAHVGGDVFADRRDIASGAQIDGRPSPPRSSRSPPAGLGSRFGSRCGWSSRCRSCCSG